MTRFEDLTQKIDNNISRLKAMTQGEHEFLSLSIQTAELIEARGNMTIGEASEVIK